MRGSPLSRTHGAKHAVVFCGKTFLAFWVSSALDTLLSVMKAWDLEKIFLHPREWRSIFLQDFSSIGDGCERLLDDL